MCNEGGGISAKVAPIWSTPVMFICACKSACTDPSSPIGCKGKTLHYCCLLLGLGYNPAVVALLCWHCLGYAAADQTWDFLLATQVLCH